MPRNLPTPVKQRVMPNMMASLVQPCKFHLQLLTSQLLRQAKHVSVLKAATAMNALKREPATFVPTVILRVVLPTTATYEKAAAVGN